jgi:hypothetical protein
VRSSPYPTLGKQMDSRLFRVEVPDTYDQVHAALSAQARDDAQVFISGNGGAPQQPPI